MDMFTSNGRRANIKRDVETSKGRQRDVKAMSKGQQRDVKGKKEHLRDVKGMLNGHQRDVEGA